MKYKQTKFKIYFKSTKSVCKENVHNFVAQVNISHFQDFTENQDKIWIMFNNI